MRLRIPVLVVLLALLLFYSLPGYAGESSPARIVLPLKIVATNHLLVPVLIDETKYWLVVDTAAGATTLDETLSKNIKFADAKMVCEAYAAGLGTAKQAVAPAIIPKLQLGEGEFKNVIVFKTDLSSINSSFEKCGISSVLGILGSEFLIRNEGIIDYGAKTLTLKVKN